MIGTMAKWKEGLANKRRLFSGKVVQKPTRPRRLQEPVSTAAGIAMLSSLAANTKITIDANKTIDQVTGLLASGAQNGAILINMAKDGKGHNMFMMPDIMNMNHSVYNENYCGHGAACSVYKTKLPGSSGKVKVCFDSNWGIPKRTHIVDEGNLYTYDGEGVSMIGTMAKWKEGLANKRRLTSRRLADIAATTATVPVPATPSAAAEVVKTLAGNTNISIDANKTVDQITALLASDVKSGAIVINNGPANINLFMMPDIMNVAHSVYNENYCAKGAACHVYKTKMPMSSGKIKVCIDGKWGTGKYENRTYIVDEGNLYSFDGEGFSMIGTIEAWKSKLANKRRLLHKKH